MNTLLPRWRDLARELGRYHQALIGPAMQHGLRLHCVPGHDDVGQQIQGIGNCLHLLDPLGLGGANPPGVDCGLERIDRLAAVERPAQLIAQGVFDHKP